MSKEKLIKGFEKNERLMKNAELLYQYVKRDLKINARGFMKLMLDAKAEIDECVKLGVCAWCSNEANKFNTLDNKIEYYTHGFCQDCQNEDEQENWIINKKN